MNLNYLRLLAWCAAVGLGGAAGCGPTGTMDGSGGADGESDGSSDTGDPSGTTTDDGDETGTDGENEPDAGTVAAPCLDLIDVSCYGEESPPQLYCSLPEPCDEPVLTGCYWDGGPETCEVWSPESEDAARCVLAALRDRAPAHVTTSVGGGGIWDFVNEIRVLDDGQAYGLETAHDDINCSFTALAGDLRPPEYFQACLDEQSGPALLDCIHDWMDETCTPQDEIVCPG